MGSSLHLRELQANGIDIDSHSEIIKCRKCHKKLEVVVLHTNPWWYYKDWCSCGKRNSCIIEPPRKNCPNCQAQIGKEANHCKYCGWTEGGDCSS